MTMNDSIKAVNQTTVPKSRVPRKHPKRKVVQPEKNFFDKAIEYLKFVRKINCDKWVEETKSYSNLLNKKA